MHKILIVALAPSLAAAMASVPGVAHGNPQVRADASAIVGSLAYVTPAAKVRLATVHANGGSTRRRIGPVTSAPTGGSVDVYNLVAGQRDNALAWTEVDLTKTGVSRGMYVVIRRGSGRPIAIPATKHGWSPLGYVGARLVVTDFTNVAVVTGDRHPHFRPIRTTNKDQPFATDAKGIIVEHGLPFAAKPETFQLVSLSGTRTTLGRLPAAVFRGKEKQIPIESVWAGPGGHHVLLEQGDHTDFGGVGPTSRAFEISGSHDSKAAALGHPDGATPIRRMEDTSFARGTPYTVWVSIGRSGTKGSVYAFSNGAWRLVATGSLLVAGNAARDVVTQPARYKVRGLDYRIIPTGDAVLHAVGSTVPLQGVKATGMVWLSQG